MQCNVVQLWAMALCIGLGDVRVGVVKCRTTMLDSPRPKPSIAAVPCDRAPRFQQLTFVIFVLLKLEFIRLRWARKLEGEKFRCAQQVTSKSAAVAR